MTSGKDRWNKNVFSCRRNEYSDWADVTLWGRLFHTRGAKTISYAPYCSGEKHLTCPNILTKYSVNKRSQPWRQVRWRRWCPAVSGLWWQPCSRRDHAVLRHWPARTRWWMPAGRCHRGQHRCRPPRRPSQTHPGHWTPDTNTSSLTAVTTVNYILGEIIYWPTTCI